MAPIIDDMGEWFFQLRDCNFKRFALQSFRRNNFKVEWWEDEEIKKFFSVFYVYMFVSSSSYNIHGLGLFIPFFPSSILVIFSPPSPFIAASVYNRMKKKKKSLVLNEDDEKLKKFSCMHEP